MFTVIRGDNIWRNLTYKQMKLKESFCRGMQVNYTIIYPNGNQLICELIKRTD
jgi:hypothetical protein